MPKPDYNEMAEACADSNGVVYLTKEVFALALRSAYEAGLERAAEIAMNVTAPKSIGRDHGRHHEAGAQSAAAAIRAEKVADDA